MRAIVAAGLCGLAWAGGSHYLHGASLWDTIKTGWAADGQQSAQRDDMAATVQEMAEEIRALKTSVDALNTAQAAGSGNAATDQSLKSQLDSMQTATSAAIADLADRVGKLETESTTKLAKVSEQLDALEHRSAPPRAASVAGAPPRKRVEHGHDAFNPSQAPYAPGAPRPLGSYVNASPAARGAY